MLPTPCKYSLSAGHSEAGTPLNAFDAALLDAGFGNLNLLRVSSILPAGAEYVTDMQVTPGSLLPTAYAAVGSQQPGDQIAAAVAVGIAEIDSIGVIMECSGHCSREEIERRIRQMVIEAFAARQLPLREIKIAAVEHRVQHCGCVFAGVGLWG